MKARPSVPVGNVRDHVHSPASFCVADTGPRVARSSDPAPRGPRLTGELRTEDPPRPLLPLQGNFSFDAPLFPGPPGAQCGSAALRRPGLAVPSLGPCARLWAPLPPGCVGSVRLTSMASNSARAGGRPCRDRSSPALWPRTPAPRPQAGSATPGKCLLRGSF